APARQPEAVAAGFEGNRNPHDRAPGPDRLILPAMQQAKQPFWVRLELLARLTLNAGKHAGNEPARLAQLDDGYHRAILVQGDEGSAQVVRLGHRGTPSVTCSDEVAILAARPIASLGPTRPLPAAHHPTHSLVHEPVLQFSRIGPEDREFADSALEQSGFELVVPLPR